VLAAVLLLSLVTPGRAQSPALAQKATEAAEIRMIAQQGSVRVIIMFDTPVAASQIRPDAASIANIRAQVASAQDAIIATHFGSATSPAPGQGFSRGLIRFAITPGFAVNVSETELDALAADARVMRINLDHVRPPSLTDSVPLIGMTTAYGLGATGSGQAVAVLDTGVKADHEFLAGKVVAEACFSNAGGGGSGVTLCPNGMTSQTGAGAANTDTPACVNGSTQLCDHGTHVAGIAAGSNTNQQGGEPANGVAKNAKIFAIQIFTRFGSSVASYDSDQIQGLDYVFANINLGGGTVVASANMSLGGGLFSSTCDSESQKPSIDNLRAAGVLTAIASGNDGSRTQISSPGCISTAVTVGSTTKVDAVSSFSNMSAVVDLLAPGSSIQSSIPIVPSSNTTTYSFFNGTSMATPHVAGAIAAVRSACPTATADAIETALKTTGTPITDTRSGGTQTKPRIRVDLAVQNLNCSAGPPGPPGPVACTFTSRLGDFNGDARSDFLFRRTTDGLAVIYFMNGTQLLSTGTVGTIGLEWTLVGIGDFNADGRADMLFRRTDGALVVFLMNGVTVMAAQIVGTVGTEWSVVGVGDFNGDGRADFMLRRTSDGMLAVYLMNGLQLVAAQVIGAVGTEWKIQGIIDLNGDGRADFLMRRTSDGMLAGYLMNGFQLVAAQIIGAVGTDWTVVGLGDFNGDGKGDFLARHPNGSLAMYLMNGLQLTAAQVIGAIGTDWTFVGTGDLNADARADIVFRRTTGVVFSYLMNGFQIVSGQVAGNLGTDFTSCYGQGSGVVAQAGQ
jgi:subtilisin family serine protease/sRNA-binding regulator protein Hfq